MTRALSPFASEKPEYNTQKPSVEGIPPMVFLIWPLAADTQGNQRDCNHAAGRYRIRHLDVKPWGLQITAVRKGSAPEGKTGPEHPSCFHPLNLPERWVSAI
jgi:hypothetical protein